MGEWIWRMLRLAAGVTGLHDFAQSVIDITVAFPLGHHQVEPWYVCGDLGVKRWCGPFDQSCGEHRISVLLAMHENASYTIHFLEGSTSQRIDEAQVSFELAE